MEWKKKLRLLELDKQWDCAIVLMQQVIKENPDDIDAYIYMNYLLMNLLVEEEYDQRKHDIYASLIKKYFDESYAKFYNNAEYLFCTGVTAVMAEWYFGIDAQAYEAMLKKAMQLEPDNLVYKRTYYMHLDKNIPKEKREVSSYAQLLLQNNSPLVESIKSRGAFGEYLLSCMQGWAERTLK